MGRCHESQNVSPNKSNEKKKKKLREALLKNIHSDIQKNVMIS